MSKLQKALFLSDKGYADLKKAIFACTLTNLAMLLPFCVTVMIFSEILSPFVSGGTIQWNHIWMLWGAGIISAILVVKHYSVENCRASSETSYELLQYKGSF